MESFPAQLGEEECWGFHQEQDPVPRILKRTGPRACGPSSSCHSAPVHTEEATCTRGQVPSPAEGTLSITRLSVGSLELILQREE